MAFVIFSFCYIKLFYFIIITVLIVQVFGATTREIVGVRVIVVSENHHVHSQR